MTGNMARRGPKPEAVKSLFRHIASRYDTANRWMTWGQDLKWRREVIDLAQLPDGGRLLDIGTGTGDLALEALQREKLILPVGADFTPEMMLVGRNRQQGNLIRWLNTDALDLPFCQGSFDAVVSGYLLRNVADVERAIIEQHRVLKSGGRMVCLDTTPPYDDLLHLPVRLYLQLVLPIIGGLIAGDIQAYRYLPESTSHFLSATELADYMRRVGFRDVCFCRFMGGTMAIHWGIK
jgi:demethylmenaquinone methyltransferase / 2-methoxy-6-polyprenyl-1,4-benzoquinol methylase